LGVAYADVNTRKDIQLFKLEEGRVATLALDSNWLGNNLKFTFLSLPIATTTTRYLIVWLVI